MKVLLKLACVGLIATGLTMWGCDRLAGEAEEDEEAAEEVEEEVEEEEEEEVDEEADEEDEEAEEEEDEEADEEDEEDEEAEEGDEEAEEEEAEEQEEAAAPTPPTTGTLEGSVSGAGISNGKLKLTITDDYSAHGEFRGDREDKRFRIPLPEGSVSEDDNRVTASGSRGNDEAELSGKVSASGVGGKINGTIHGKDFEVRFNLSN